MGCGMRKIGCEEVLITNFASRCEKVGARLILLSRKMCACAGQCGASRLAKEQTLDAGGAEM